MTRINKYKKVEDREPFPKSSLFSEFTMKGPILPLYSCKGTGGHMSCTRYAIKYEQKDTRGQEDPSFRNRL